MIFEALALLIATPVHKKAEAVVYQ